MRYRSVSRRAIIGAVPIVALAENLTDRRTRARPKIAAVVTEYRKWSHAQHIVDRFLDGYGWEGRHHHPPMDLVSLYVDQVGANDLSRERAGRFPAVKIYPTIAQALTLGGSKLAIDGVLLIGEHGKYPTNEKGQTLYPRYEFFQQIVDVYRSSGRTAPVFNDKHLSWKWEWARQMVDTSKSMDFAFMAGSSVPLVWRLPEMDMPWEAAVEEALCIGVGGVDSYDFHALEALQCMVERRRGGETGVVAMQALKGERVWKALNAGSWSRGGWDADLFEACLCRSHSLTPTRQGFSHVYPSFDKIPALVENPVAYRYEYADGLKATMLLLEGLVSPFHFAARLRGGEIISTYLFLPGRGAGNEGTEAPFFNPLVHAIERMFLTGQATYPVERTLLTTGLTAAGVESLWRGQQRMTTPHLAIRYRARKESLFWKT